jgi:hypothetical protein
MSPERFVKGESERTLVDSAALTHKSSPNLCQTEGFCAGRTLPKFGLCSESQLARKRDQSLALENGLRPRKEARSKQHP